MAEQQGRFDDALPSAQKFPPCTRAKQGSGSEAQRHSVPPRPHSPEALLPTPAEHKLGFSYGGKITQKLYEKCNETNEEHLPRWNESCFPASKPISYYAAWTFTVWLCSQVMRSTLIQFSFFSFETICEAIYLWIQLVILFHYSDQPHLQQIGGSRITATFLLLYVFTYWNRLKPILYKSAVGF